MPIPDARFSGCCDWGFDLIGRVLQSGLCYFKDPANFTIDTPGGSASVEFVTRNISDFDPVDWSSSGIPNVSAGAITVDSSGNVYLAYPIGIVKYNSAFSSQWTYSTSVSGYLDTQTFPWVNSSGEVWARIGHTDFSGNNPGVVKVTSAGALDWTVSGDDITGGSGDLVECIALAPSDYCFVSCDDGTLARLDSTGTVDWSTGISAVARDMATDSSGNVYLVTTTEDSVRSYDTSGSLRWSRRFHTGVTQPTSSTFWHAICLDKDENVIVSGQRDSSVWCIKKINGSTQSDIWTEDLTTYLWAFTLASDTYGNIYASCRRNDSGANTFNSQRQYNSAGSILGGDVPTQQTFYCAAAPGRYPHFT